MQFSEIIALPSRGKIATRLHDAMARFADRYVASQNIKSLQYFGNFSEDVALLAQDMLHVQFFPRDGNAIIS